MFLPISDKKEIFIHFFMKDGVPSCRKLNLVDCTSEVQAVFLQV